MISFLLSFAINGLAVAYLLFLIQLIMYLIGYPAIFSAVYHYMSITGLPVTIGTTSLFCGFSVMLLLLLFSYLPPVAWLIRYTSGIRIVNQKDLPEAYYDKYSYALRLLRENGIPIERFRWYVGPYVELNAFSFGRRMVIVNAGLLENQHMEEDLLAGVLAHEVGHILHGDTRWGYGTYITERIGLVVSYVFLVAARFFRAFRFIPFLGWLFVLFSDLVVLQVDVFRSFFQGLFRFVYLYLNRRREYMADRYACQMGFGNELYLALSYIAGPDESLGFWRRLKADHPQTEKRLDRIRTYLQMHEG